jgi:TPR repeat protein
MKAKIRALFSSLGVFGGALLYIGLAVAILAVFFSTLNILAAIANVLAAASILILIPLLIIAALFKRARKFCGTGTLIISYAWGASTWLTATVYLNDLWGKVAVVIGVFCFGVGSVPLGCLALLLRGRFGPLFMILGQLVFVYILRILGIWIESTRKPESIVAVDFTRLGLEREGTSTEQPNHQLPQGAQEQYEFALRLINEARESIDVTEDAPPEEIAASTDRLHQRFRSAVRWLRKAAEQGHGEAQLLLGVFLSSGDVFSFLLDPEEAAEWFRKAAEQGLSGAQLALARQYQNGRGVPRDEREAMRWFSKAAEQGDEDAQLALGMMYYAGDGVDEDQKTAALWIRKAAEKGLAAAQANLGIMYQNGYGVRTNYRNASVWFRKAAEQGHASSQRELGLYYLHGRGVEQDFPSAAHWLNQGAEQGDADAQFELAILYLNGRGVEQSVSTAVEWAMRAAEQDHVGAQCFLGEAYRVGDGVPKDQLEAGKWYRKAARQGDTVAQQRLFDTEGVVVLGELGPIESKRSELMGDTK